LIGVLAVIAILAALLLPALLKQFDKTVADQEKSNMKSFADAFQQYVLHTRVIPDQTTWYVAIASQLGFGTNEILYNVRQQSHLQQRVFLIDPALQLGLASAPTHLPYSQTNFVFSVANCPMLPVNPRIMIVSSLGKALPGTLTSGIFSPGHPEYFADLWNAADGTVPSDLAWSGWTGNAADVVVQRVNLAPLFVHLFLNECSSCNAFYSIDGAAPTNLPTLNPISGYFIQGSVLRLYTNSISPPPPVGVDTQQILARDGSFLFENGVWRGSLSGSLLGSGIMNIGDVVQQFLNATPNVNAQNPSGNAQQKLVVDSMLNYMSNYNVWAIQYNFNNSSLKSYLSSLQSEMMLNIQGLYGSPAYFPTNASSCLQ